MFCIIHVKSVLPGKVRIAVRYSGQATGDIVDLKRKFAVSVARTRCKRSNLKKKHEKRPTATVCTVHGINNL